jgi:hypothetical protein
MSHITHADARKFWCDAYLKILDQRYMKPSEVADRLLDHYAARFGDEQLLAEIEANKARREQGNMP